MENTQKKHLSFNKLEVDMIINNQKIPVTRHFCFVDNVLYHINYPKQKFIKMNGQNKPLPEKIYMIRENMTASTPIHKEIEKYFNK